MDPIGLIPPWSKIVGGRVFPAPIVQRQMSVLHFAEQCRFGFPALRITNERVFDQVFGFIEVGVGEVAADGLVGQLSRGEIRHAPLLERAQRRPGGEQAGIGPIAVIVCIPIGGAEDGETQLGGTGDIEHDALHGRVAAQRGALEALHAIDPDLENRGASRADFIVNADIRDEPRGRASEPSELRFRIARRQVPPLTVAIEGLLSLPRAYGI